jgi:cytosine/adenosine deaminase-related metal-dependent hydrolase
MALGENAAFHSEHAALQDQCGVGVDCHSNNSASIPSELRLLLQSTRSAYNKKFTNQGNVPKKVNKTVEEAFNLGTVGGARAVGMDGKIGTLKVGAFADVLVWDALSPGMVCGAQHDPVAAIILHSSPSDVEVVIVDGVVRKRGGKLGKVNVQEGRGLWAGEERDSLEWKDVTKELVKRREVLQEKVEKIDMKEARKGMIKGFYIDESRILDAA